MLPSELKLTSLGHCFVHLPETFVSKQPAVKGGAIVSIKSIQSDQELFVIWNGQLTSGEHVELDISFGQANKFSDELVIISSVDDLDPVECLTCRAELLDSSDYAILSQHSEANVLDSCRLITHGLVIPIFVSQHVKVLVKIDGFEPSDKSHAMLTKWTELSFTHNLTEIPKKLDDDDATNENESLKVNHSLPFIPYALGISSIKPNFFNGTLLIHGDKGCGKTFLLKKVVHGNGPINGEYHNCQQLRGKRPESIKKFFNDAIARLSDQKGLSVLALDDIDAFLEFDTKLDDERGQEVLYKKRLITQFCHLLKHFERNDGSGTTKVPNLVIASCRSLDSLGKRLIDTDGRHYFSEIIHIPNPDLIKRIEILKSLTSECRQVRCALTKNEQFGDIARKCNSFTPADLRRLVERAVIGACSRSSLEFNSEPVTLQIEDFLESLEGYIPINLRSVSLQHKSSLRTLDEVGGMDEIKTSLKKTILLPLKYPNLYSKFPIRRQNSVLLYGPPGCGKTMLAEAIANQPGLNSICVRGPELLSKYIGASEAAVRDLFKRAQLARPCVVFFDEFESLVAKRGADSTGVTDRVVNQFLTILDGVEGLSNEVFIIAATSRPDMIDSAMLRPGRLDKHIYCPIPDKHTRAEIIKLLGRSIHLDPKVDLNSLAIMLEGFTGADINSLLCSSQLAALNEMIDSTAKVSKSDDILRDDANQSSKRIVVTNKHIGASYSEMAPNVRSNLSYLLEKYPDHIGSTNRQKVALRSTLA